MTEMIAAVLIIIVLVLFVGGCLIGYVDKLTKYVNELEEENKRLKDLLCMDGEVYW